MVLYTRSYAHIKPQYLFTLARTLICFLISQNLKKLFHNLTINYFLAQMHAIANEALAEDARELAL